VGTKGQCGACEGRGDVALSTLLEIGYESSSSSLSECRRKTQA
jgi:hypothetical protein